MTRLARPASAVLANGISRHGNSPDSEIRALARRALAAREPSDDRPGARLRAIGASSLEAKLAIGAHDSVIRDALANFTWYEAEGRGEDIKPRGELEVIATWARWGIS